MAILTSSMPPTTGGPHDMVFDLGGTNSLSTELAQSSSVMVWGMVLPPQLIWLVNEGPGRSASKGLAVSMHCFSLQSLALFAGFGTTRYAPTFHTAFVAMVGHSLVADELVSDHQEGLTLRLDITLPSWKHVHHCCYGSRLSTFMAPTLS